LECWRSALIQDDLAEEAAMSKPCSHFHDSNYCQCHYTTKEETAAPVLDQQVDGDRDSYSIGMVTFIAEDGGIMEEFFNSLPCDIANDDTDYVADYVYYLISLISALPSSEKYFPDIESRMIYLRHLYYLSTADNWKNFKPEEIRDIIVELRKWVLETKTKIDKDSNVKHPNFPYNNIHIKDELNIVIKPNLYPVDIYKRVGCKIFDNTIWEGIK